ncbi:hypothetical protein SAMN04488058_10158 [Deinococcus reticulitermitis]|uniref:Uncharacterized protein n=1 Tax=Deinococcus reticulitermitis TaxID=856736 RepID=A0A1H6RSR6_9DEIO|nr:hypothetical protein [Deinococcus reticulitermitis]SEI58791.1 hypothetical protein SAMN04488058_10158 [Deinococcus reticulitermitis]
MDPTHQIELAGFPPEVQVTHEEGPGGLLLRARSAGRGLELLITAEALGMYGEGPAVSLGLSQLLRAVEAGLPDIEPGVSPARVVFVGD